MTAAARPRPAAEPAAHGRDCRAGGRPHGLQGHPGVAGLAQLLLGGGQNRPVQLGVSWPPGRTGSGRSHFASSWRRLYSGAISECKNPWRPHVTTRPALAAGGGSRVQLGHRQLLPRLDRRRRAEVVQALQCRHGRRVLAGDQAHVSPGRTVTMVVNSRSDGRLCGSRNVGWNVGKSFGRLFPDQESRKGGIDGTDTGGCPAAYSFSWNCCWACPRYTPSTAAATIDPTRVAVPRDRHTSLTSGQGPGCRGMRRMARSPGCRRTRACLPGRLADPAQALTPGRRPQPSVPSQRVGQDGPPRPLGQGWTRLMAGGPSWLR